MKHTLIDLADAIQEAIQLRDGNYDDVYDEAMSLALQVLSSRNKEETQ